MPNRWWYKNRGLVMFPPVAVMISCTWGELEWGAATWPTGAALFGAGLLLRLWSQLHLQYRLPVKTALTTDGPYRYVRNPIYIGNTLILAGLAVMSELLWLCPLVVAYCALIYHAVVRHEEGHLAAKYGQAYLSYRRQVPRWLPLHKPAVPGGRAAALHVWASALMCEAHNLLLLLLPLAKEGITGTWPK